MADAPALGAGVRLDVEVRVLSPTLTRLGDPLNNESVALPAAATKRRRTGPQASPLQLMRDRQHQARAAGPDRVSDGDRAAIDVDALLVQSQHPARVQRDRGERLVDLDEVQVARIEAGLLESIAQRQRWHGVQPRIAVRAHTVSHDLDQRLDLERLRPLFRHHDHRRGAIRYLRRVAGRDRPLGSECGWQLAKRLCRCPRTHAFIALDAAPAPPAPRVRDEVRRLRPGLHPAADDALDLAGTNALIGQRDRVQARQAHLIDGDGRDLLRDAGLDRRLARSDLTGSSLQNLAHDHVIHVAGLHTAALEGRPDRMAAQRDRRHIFESSAKLAEWRARARYDHG